MAFYELEPFGTWRDNYHTAMLAHMYASAHAGKGPKPKFRDFFYLDPAVKASNERKNMIAKMNALAEQRKPDGR